MVHVPTRRAYALKTQPSSGFSGGVQRRVIIAQEIACMREASSPFLMRFYGEMDTRSQHAIDPDVSSMLLEHLGGGSLEELMGGKGEMFSLDAPSTRFYMACAVAGLDALHGAGWMHRDLAAKNVVIANNGYAKIIDCGLAKRVKEGEKTYTTCGTPIYIAPEVIQQTGYGHQSEMWTLGVMLHELFSGMLPFFVPKSSTAQGNARRMELYKAIMKTEPAMDALCFSSKGVDLYGPDFPMATQHLIRQLLVKKAADRITLPLVRTHPFFHGFDWASFHANTMPPPVVPERDAALPDPR